MIKKFFTIILAIMFFSLSSNFAYAKRTMTQLELREMETRFYETNDTTQVMKAAINTLQDSGFVIQEVEPELGFIRARKTFKDKHVNKARVAGWSLWLALITTYTVFTWGSTAYNMVDPSRRISNELKDKTVVVDSNVNVEPFGTSKTKVRFVMVGKVMLNADGYSFVKSAPTKVFRLYTPKVYQEFFAQLDKSIFYEGI
ncbi:hypothetical protein HDR58_00225 [bacterium]|nr:hypothetical protein [bacterium]